MTARGMHYDVKQKLNKIDSQKYREIKVPEIDWKLNEAQEIFVKMIAEPRSSQTVGFEVNERTIDDIRTLVVDQKPSEYLIPQQFDDTSFIVTLPDDYWYKINITVLASKGSCKGVALYDSKTVQHDDSSESSPFDESSFEWRVSNYRYNKDGIRLFTDGTFTIDKVGLDYLKRPPRICNAVDWIGGTYEGLDGNTYTGMQDCILPEGTHSEIVDIAVMMIANDLNLPSYQLKQDKVKIVEQ